MSKNNQNHYSVEDMVDAAQSKAASSSGKKNETREVVVQEDGTKVVKVRRRKRKSKSSTELLSTQEDEKKSYVKMLLMTLAVGFILSLLLVGYFLFQVARFNSPDHITKIEQFLSARATSEVDVQGYRLGPNSSQMDKVVLKSGIIESPAMEATLSHVKLDHRPETVIMGRVSGGEATAASAQLVVDYDKEVKPFKQKSDEVQETIPYDYEDISLDKVEIALHSAKNAPRLIEAEGKLLKRTDGDVQLILRDGKLQNIKGLPSILETAIIVNKKEEISVRTLKLSDVSVGHMEIKGEFSKVTKVPQTLSCNFHQLRLESLDENLEDIIEARVNSEDGSIFIAPVEKKYRVETDLKTTQGGISLKNFLFLETIGEKFGNFGYPYVSFNNSSEVQLIIDNEGYQFKNIEFEKAGDLAMQGEFFVNYSGALTGKIKVGIPTARIVKKFPDANRDEFITDKGYTWFNVNLSGTAEKPLDDFEERFDEVVDALH